MQPVPLHLSPHMQYSAQAWKSSIMFYRCRRRQWINRGQAMVERGICQCTVDGISEHQHLRTVHDSVLAHETTCMLANMIGCIGSSTHQSWRPLDTCATRSARSCLVLPDRVRA